MVTDTGVPRLNEMLNGGYPENRAILLTGTPGSGKSTLAMQFLQQGLDEGEECLFISTEQTPDELTDSFARFNFELDHDALTLTSVHAATGRTLDSDEPQMVMETFDDTEIFWPGIEFNSQRIIEVLERFRDADRVVLDSVSGLEVMAPNRQEFRRGVLDLIQLFTADFEATTLLTAEFVDDTHTSQGIENISDQNTVQYTTHGVIRLWRERKHGQYRRFIDVMKMRGVDHDTRRYELHFGEGGVTVVPNRQRPEQYSGMNDLFSTNVDELDEILGGGLIQNGMVLLEHDGHVQMNEFILQLVRQAIDTDRTITALPSTRVQLDEMMTALDVERTLVEMLEDDDLYVLSPVEIAGLAHENVYRLTGDDDYTQAVNEIHTETNDDERFTIFDAEALLDAISPDTVERMWRKAAAAMIHSQDVIVYLMNTNSPDDETRSFLEDSADQIIHLWQEPDGLEYLKLEKSITGTPGVSRLMSLQSDPPYPPYLELY